MDTPAVARCDRGKRRQYREAAEVANQLAPTQVAAEEYIGAEETKVVIEEIKEPTPNTDAELPTKFK